MYLQGIAMMFKSYRVLMELDGDTPKGARMWPALLLYHMPNHSVPIMLPDVGAMCCAVYINEKQLAETKKHIQRHAWHFEDGTSVEVEWDMYKPTIGNTVTVTTGGNPSPAAVEP